MPPNQDENHNDHAGDDTPSPLAPHEPDPSLQPDNDPPWALPPQAADGQSRRRFLRNAVIATAAASAATGGIAVAAQATGLGPRLLSSVRPATQGASPTPQLTCGLCVQAGFGPTNDLIYNNNYSVWITLQHLLGGQTYTITLDLRPTSRDFGLISAFVGHADPIARYAETAGSATTCPFTAPGTGVSQSVGTNRFPFTFTYTPAGSEDIQAQVQTLVSSAPFPFHPVTVSGAFYLTLADSLGNTLCSSQYNVGVTF